MSIYNNEQRGLNQAFDAEGNFDGLNHEIKKINQQESNKKIETQVNKLKTLPKKNKRDSQRSEHQRDTMVFELKDITAALNQAINQTIDQSNQDIEIQEIQEQLNKALNQ